ncbi:MAG: hypothetical protein Greene101420_674 [Parcubacteria group bacterium Greene1014_20]|nr:MAG: hypothetical protein Greene041636_668 [Parcubacteria group bacterium Greene0416_36]TSC98622.1 MAG: hypothetical protein Greene101420_674 [Parcubacteria group bacterium Greene1014_20]
MLPKLNKPSDASPSSGKMPRAYWVKTFVCLVVFWAAMAFFGLVCRELVDNYFILLLPSAGVTISWIVRLLMGSLFVGLSTGILVMLVRPAWVVITAYIIGSILFALMLGAGFSGWIVALIFAAALTVHFWIAERQMNNQIHYSIHPLSDLKLFLFACIAGLSSIAFGLGYQADVARRQYAIPPEIRKLALDSSTKQFGIVLEVLKIGAAQRQVFMGNTEKSIAAALEGMEQQLKSYASVIPLVLGAVLFALLLPFFFLLSILEVLGLAILMFFLRLLGFAHVRTEMLEVERLTLHNLK